jgi:SAM-dependent methyltransferase
LISEIPDYHDLDGGGEAAPAAARMEARAQEPMSDAMFRALVLPLTSVDTRSVLELGCGTAALSRRLARVYHHAQIVAVDKSRGMLEAARALIEREGARNVQLAEWDVLEEDHFPFKVSRYNLILSSVLVPYLKEAETAGLVKRMVGRLEAGGILAFVEQDLMSDTLFDPTGLARRVLAKEDRVIRKTQGLGLRRLLREEGLRLFPKQSFLWADERYGAYTRDLLGRMADAARSRGDLTEAEVERFKGTMEDLVRAGDFQYTMTYHLVAGRLF